MREVNHPIFHEHGPRPLTAKQAAFLDHIRQTIQQTNSPPSLLDLSTKFGITQTAILGALKALRAKGYINMAGQQTRTITITDTA